MATFIFIIIKINSNINLYTEIKKNMYEYVKNTIIFTLQTH